MLNYSKEIFKWVGTKNRISIAHSIADIVGRDGKVYDRFYNLVSYNEALALDGLLKHMDDLYEKMLVEHLSGLNKWREVPIDIPTEYCNECIFFSSHYDDLRQHRIYWCSLFVKDLIPDLDTEPIKKPRYESEIYKVRICDECTNNFK